MKQMIRWMMVAGIAGMMSAGAVSADSFSAYFGNAGWGFSMNFGGYDYYNRYSPGFYEYDAMNFRTALDPYGMWRYMPELGAHVWIPYVPAGWRPYKYGSWSYTSYGWTWNAYEPWGWIPHHYGNWIFHPVYAWVWIPGYTWSPANVVWGFFNGYYGWAPLPPRHAAYAAYWRNHSHHHRDRWDNRYHWYSRSHHDPSGYSGQHRNENDDYYQWIPNDAWVIVSGNHFMNDNIAEVALDTNRNTGVFQNRSFRLNAQAPSKNVVEKDIRRPVQMIKVDEVTKEVDGHRIKVVRPQKMEQQQVRHIGKVTEEYRPAVIQKRKAEIGQPVKPQQNAPVAKPKPGPVVHPGQKPVSNIRQEPVGNPKQDPVVKPNRNRPSNRDPQQPMNQSFQKKPGQDVRPASPARPAPPQRINQPKPAEPDSRPVQPRPETVRPGQKDTKQDAVKPAGKKSVRPARSDKAAENDSKEKSDEEKKNEKPAGGVFQR